jgi:hypothetical protein
MTLSKTDYLIYRGCRKNAWLKSNRPDVYHQSGLSEFDLSIIETGNEVELEARKLFPGGALIEGRDTAAREATVAHIERKTPILFQPVFMRDNFLAALDILQYNADAGGYFLYEVKASSHVKEDEHLPDLAFQMVLLEGSGIRIVKSHIVHLNSGYSRLGNLDTGRLFTIADVTDAVQKLTAATKAEMAIAQQYLSQDAEPKGHCDCIYKGRSNHCTAFRYSNPDVPEYSVHDLARIGSSKAKLAKLVDNSIFHLENLPADIGLSVPQQNQVDTYVQNRTLILRDKIAEELNGLQYPIYFLDYETCPAAIPRFDGFAAHQQIPFQYSLHILDRPDGALRHEEFLSTTPNDPSFAFVASLRQHIGDEGSIVVWNKTFETGINKDLGKRIPDAKEFLDAFNGRVYDLRDVFTKQFYVHKDFRGGTSIKDVLPVLAPELSYKDLAIQEGGTASQTWDKIASGTVSQAEKETLARNLKAYCERDTYAMYVIWRHLSN